MNNAPETNRDIADSDIFVRDVINNSYAKLHEGLKATEIADFIVSAANDTCEAPVKVISLLGGAASGKSSLAQGVTEAFTAHGQTADRLSTDDYVVGDRAYRREHFEGREPLAKYDFDHLNKDVTAIRTNTSGETAVAVPTYDPVSGVAIAAGESNYQHHVGKVDALIVEGDFDVVESPDVKLYLHTEADARLQNRLGRDSVERAEADLDKIRENFEQRQVTQHEPYTSQAIEGADYVIEATVSDDGWLYDVYAPAQAAVA